MLENSKIFYICKKNHCQNSHHFHSAKKHRKGQQLSYSKTAFSQTERFEKNERLALSLWETKKLLVEFGQQRSRRTLVPKSRTLFTMPSDAKAEGMK